MIDLLYPGFYTINTNPKKSVYMDDAQFAVNALVLANQSSWAEEFEVLVEQAGGIVAGKLAILAEGDAASRDDIKYLQYLPLFDENGEPLKG